MGQLRVHAGKEGEACSDVASRICSSEPAPQKKYVREGGIGIVSRRKKKSRNQSPVGVEGGGTVSQDDTPTVYLRLAGESGWSLD